MPVRTRRSASKLLTMRQRDLLHCLPQSDAHSLSKHARAFRRPLNAPPTIPHAPKAGQWLQTARFEIAAYLTSNRSRQCRN